MIPTPNHTRGFTLLEVMIALVIFSIGLLGLAGLQARGLQSNSTAQNRTTAMILAYDMANRLRANPAGVAAGDYNNLDSTNPTAGDCISAACTAAQMATYDYYEWQQTINNALPKGHGTVTGGATPPFTITVMWDEERTGATGTACSGNPSVDLKCYSMTFEP
jgi:type IV pilus assembly protein PilV